MKKFIKKQNEIQALRVFTISKLALRSIGKIEEELVFKNVSDSSLYQLIEGYKKELDSLTQSYLDHLEKCTDDLIEVNAAIINGFKVSTESIIKQIEEHKAAFIPELNTEHVAEKSALKLNSRETEA